MNPDLPVHRPVILYRGREFEEQELPAAKAAGFFCTDSRMDVGTFDLVIPRYSALPFYKELEHDIRLAGGELINSHRQHRYVADLQNWYQDLERYTPKTWFRPSDVPMDEPGSFVLKGETNSKKFLWDTHCYAEDRGAIGTILCNLQNDSLVGSQSIYVRRFEKFKTYRTGLHGLPVTSEFRCFFFRTTLLCGGYYWSSHIEELRNNGVSDSELGIAKIPSVLLSQVAARIADQVNFFVVDFAETEDGSWRIVELNDAQQAGLSECQPEKLYGNLMTSLTIHYNIK